MNQEDIIRMAVAAGFPERRAFSDLSDLYPRLERFASLVAAAECEACAKLCEQNQHSEYDGHAECAAAIRKRGASVNP